MYMSITLPRREVPKGHSSIAGTMVFVATGTWSGALCFVRFSLERKCRGLSDSRCRMTSRRPWARSRSGCCGMCWSKTTGEENSWANFANRLITSELLPHIHSLSCTLRRCHVSRLASSSSTLWCTDRVRLCWSFRRWRRAVRFLQIGNENLSWVQARPGFRYVNMERISRDVFLHRFFVLTRSDLSRERWKARKNRSRAFTPRQKPD